MDLTCTDSCGRCGCVCFADLYPGTRSIPRYALGRRKFCTRSFLGVSDTATVPSPSLRCRPDEKTVVLVYGLQQLGSRLVVVPAINDGGVSRVMPMMAGSDVQRRLGSRQLDDALATCVVEEVRISLNLRALHSTSHASYFTELHISQNFLPNGGKSRHCEYDAGSSPLLLSGTLPNAT